MDDQLDDQFDPKHLPVVQRVLRADRAGPIAMTVTALGAAFVVTVVLYGMTRELPHQQTASAPAIESPAPDQPARPNQQQDQGAR